MSPATPLHYGRVKQGRIVFDDPLAWALHVQCLEGQMVEVTARRRRTQRSLKQNAFYWAVVCEGIARAATEAQQKQGYDITYDKDDVHTSCKMLFLRLTNPDEPIQKTRSTTDLTPEEFTTYINECMAWGAQEFGAEFPDERALDLGDEWQEVTR